MTGFKTLFKSALMAAGLILPAQAQYGSGELQLFSRRFAKAKAEGAE